MMKKLLPISSLCLFLFTATSLKAQNPKLTLDLTKPGANVSPQLYGLMTEEINHSYDGGLYAELIKNRIFKDNPNTPEAWSLIREGGAKATIQLVAANPGNVPTDQQRQAINGALTTCLRLVVDTGGGRAGIANEGYWGIPVLPNTTYNASFYIKGTDNKPFPPHPWDPKPTVAVPVIADNTAGPITVSIESNDGKTVYASGTINLVKSTFWKKYELKLTTGADVKPTSAARFVISTNRTGVYYFNLVSLFPPTYHNRPNGNRKDIMKLLADMKPKFLRFPGGNFLEGPKLNDAFPWKTTLGPLEGRPGHTGSWGYRPTDGMGLLEFLEWCEDLKMEPLLAVYAGYSLDGDHVDAGPLLKPYVDDALDEIEYVTGDIHTYWGAKRAADGHPAPFKLSYVEIGNEDGFDESGSYGGRFAQFYDGIKAKYPNLHCIATIGGKDWLGGRGKLTIREPEVVDEHYYRDAWGMEADAAHYDNYDRNGYKVFVGEWATTEGKPTTNLNAALGDAAWMTGMERNSDLVIRSCYAPLFANVNKATPTAPKAWQWESNLIGYDALTSFGSPSYYVQAMFNSYIGDKVVPVSGINIPTQTRPATKQDSAANKMPEPIPTMFYVATQDTKTGKLFLKVVNATGKPQQVDIDLNGAGKLSPEGTLVVIKGDKPEDTNTISDPVKIVPVTSKIKVAGAKFTRTFDPYSVSVLQINTLTK
ncbi:alpha-L-arabinofuranosidase C-terminal domain-containing protein [Mucilaginibacter sp. X5P1]|uniref:alpha-L-arabinofuranosidase C-terminal domain-containing protein n=1 Tax=Mucilaginibacter sp. X5P1 TaxID=2723088 RepID=UPI0017FBDAF4|nr:alpha-N-arabinofuranosidase [Mucilaginibacter sp. X5P1]